MPPSKYSQLLINDNLEYFRYAYMNGKKHNQIYIPQFHIINKIKKPLDSQPLLMSKSQLAELQHVCVRTSFFQHHTNPDFLL